jgi:hypothetical protein
MKGRACIDRHGIPCYRRVPSARVHRALQLLGVVCAMGLIAAIHLVR